MSCSAPGTVEAAGEAGSHAMAMLQQPPSNTRPQLPAQGWGRCSGRRWAGAAAAVSGQAGETHPRAQGCRHGGAIGNEVAELTSRQGTLVACRFSVVAWPMYLLVFFPPQKKHHTVRAEVVAASSTKLKGP